MEKKDNSHIEIVQDKLDIIDEEKEKRNVKERISKRNDRKNEKTKQ